MNVNPMIYNTGIVPPWLQVDALPLIPSSGDGTSDTELHALVGSRGLTGFSGVVGAQSDGRLGDRLAVWIDELQFQVGAFHNV